MRPPITGGLLHSSRDCHEHRMNAGSETNDYRYYRQRNAGRHDDIFNGGRAGFVREEGTQLAAH
jgi:hypothetical protein